MLAGLFAAGSQTGQNSENAADWHMTVNCSVVTGSLRIPKIAELEISQPSTGKCCWRTNVKLLGLPRLMV